MNSLAAANAPSLSAHIDLLEPFERRLRLVLVGAKRQDCSVPVTATFFVEKAFDGAGFDAGLPDDFDDGGAFGPVLVEIADLLTVEGLHVDAVAGWFEFDPSVLEPSFGTDFVPAFVAFTEPGFQGSFDWFPCVDAGFWSFEDVEKSHAGMLGEIGALA